LMDRANELLDLSVCAGRMRHLPHGATDARDAMSAALKDVLLAWVTL
jgi:hypothetical protein